MTREDQNDESGACKCTATLDKVNQYIQPALFHGTANCCAPRRNKNTAMGDERVKTWMAQGETLENVQGSLARLRGFCWEDVVNVLEHCSNRGEHSEDVRECQVPNGATLINSSTSVCGQHHTTRASQNIPQDRKRWNLGNVTKQSKIVPPSQCTNAPKLSNDQTRYLLQTRYSASISHP